MRDYRCKIEASALGSEIDVETPVTAMLEKITLVCMESVMRAEIRKNVTDNTTVMYEFLATANYVTRDVVHIAR